MAAPPWGACPRRRPCPFYRLCGLACRAGPIHAPPRSEAPPCSHLSKLSPAWRHPSASPGHASRRDAGAAGVGRGAHELARLDLQLTHPGSRLGSAMRGRQAERLLRLLFLLSSWRTGATVPELAAELGVSRRTVYRDLEILQQVGLPLETRRGAVSVWRLDASWRRSVPLSLAELSSLQVAAKAARAVGADPWLPALDRAMRKLGAATPGRLLLKLEEQAARISVSERGRGRGGQRRAKVDAAVLEALEDCRAITLQYQPPGAPAPRRHTVHPYHLRVAQGGVYLLGYDTRRRRVCTFRLDRIRMAVVASARFEPPADFDGARFFAEAFDVYRSGPLIDVEAEVAPRIVPFLQARRWHPSQRLRRTGEGARLSLRVRDTPELRAWLKAFGSDLLVLRPEALGRALRADAERMLLRYALRRAEKRGATEGSTGRR